MFCFWRSSVTLRCSLVVLICVLAADSSAHGSSVGQQKTGNHDRQVRPQKRRYRRFLDFNFDSSSEERSSFNVYFAPPVYKPPPVLQQVSLLLLVSSLVSSHHSPGHSRSASGGGGGGGAGGAGGAGAGVGAGVGGGGGLDLLAPEPPPAPEGGGQIPTEPNSLIDVIIPLLFGEDQVHTEGRHVNFTDENPSADKDFEYREQKIRIRTETKSIYVPPSPTSVQLVNSSEQDLPNDAMLRQLVARKNSSIENVPYSRPHP